MSLLHLDKFLQVEIYHSVDYADLVSHYRCVVMAWDLGDKKGLRL